MITVLMTAFYSFRVIFMTFGGEYKGGAAAASVAQASPAVSHQSGQAAHSGHEAHAHLHESPPVMVGPMLVLAVLAIFSGFWNVTGGFNAFMGEGETHGFFEGLFGVFTHSWLPLTALLVALFGIFLAYAIYSKKWVSNESIGRAFKPLYVLFSRKYFLDELYQDIIVRKVLVGGLFAAFQWIDTHIVDGTVNGLAHTTAAAGGVVRRTESGQLQAYGMAIGIGVIAIVIFLLIFG
jgi:NADH-quinone oxidoreductase subunit L